MKSFSKTTVLLASVIVLTACGGNQTTTGNVNTGGQTNPPPTDPLGDDNTAPVISGTPSLSVDEGSAYQFTPAASDDDGDSLTFTVQNLPAWAAFDANTGRLSGTPGYDAAGLYSDVTISVSDGELTATLPAYDIVVNDVTTSVPPTEQAPVLVSATISGSDIVLSWTQAGLTPQGGYDIFIDGTDTGTQYRTTALTTSIGGLDLATSHCFLVESRYTASSSFYTSNQLCSDAQQVGNHAPTISGTPAASIVAGSQYAFTPSASDADNDSLSFSVSNLPSWASFDNSTGAVTGTPQESDVGDYTDIQISVTDGTDTAALNAFAISVQTGTVQTGSLTVNWSAPATRTDGTALNPSEIGGYIIYLGTSSNNLQEWGEMRDGAATSYTINNLTYGTYYIAVTSYDTDGSASSYSNIVTKTLN